MVAVVTLFWNICILRVGPESVPARVWLAVALIIANIAVALVLHQMVEAAEGLTALQALGIGLVNIATVAVVTRSALSFRKFDDRFLATLTALIGTDLLISVLIVAADQFGKLVGFPMDAATFVLQIWGIVVWGFIYQRAFNTTLLFGILIALGIGLLAFYVSMAAIVPLT